MVTKIVTASAGAALVRSRGRVSVGISHSAKMSLMMSSD